MFTNNMRNPKKQAIPISQAQAWQGKKNQRENDPHKKSDIYTYSMKTTNKNRSVDLKLKNVCSLPPHHFAIDCSSQNKNRYPVKIIYRNQAPYAPSSRYARRGNPIRELTIESVCREYNTRSCQCYHSYNISNVIPCKLHSCINISAIAFLCTSKAK